MIANLANITLHPNYCIFLDEFYILLKNMIAFSFE